MFREWQQSKEPQAVKRLRIAEKCGASRTQILKLKQSAGLLGDEHLTPEEMAGLL